MFVELYNRDEILEYGKAGLLWAKHHSYGDMYPVVDMPNTATAWEFMVVIKPFEYSRRYYIYLED